MARIILFGRLFDCSRGYRSLALAGAPAGAHIIICFFVVNVLTRMISNRVRLGAWLLYWRMVNEVSAGACSRDLPSALGAPIPLARRMGASGCNEELSADTSRYSLVYY